MYVIYVNDRPLTLLSKEEHRTRASAQKEYTGQVNGSPVTIAPGGPAGPTHLTANYSGKPRTLLHYADMLEKGSPRVLSVDIVAADLEQLWRDFRGKYKWVAAAGGVVRHSGSGNTLFIYRRGSWDLPKGKIDEGEDTAAAALREVTEETGAANLALGPELLTTYHTYRNRKEKRVLKPTYWFRMKTEQDELTPEEAEDIELAEWRSAGELVASAEPLYASLRFLLKTI